MNQNVRMTAAIVLCAGIYFVWMSFFAPKPTEPVVETPVATTEPTTTPASDSAPVIAAAAADPSRETQADIQTLTLENAKAHFAINTQGGVVTSVTLKEYKASAEKDAAEKTLVSDTPGSSALFLGLDGYANWNDQKTFAVVSQSPTQIVLAWEDGVIRVEKTFALNPEGTDYQLDISGKVSNISANPVALTPFWQNRITQKTIADAPGFLSFLSKSSTEAERYLPSYMIFEDTAAKTGTHVEWSKLTTLDDKASWAGIGDRYFLMATAPKPLSQSESATTYTREGETLRMKMNSTPVTLMPGQTQTAEAVTYFGPKKTADLKLAGAQFEKIVDYGFFGVLATPILWLMTAIHKIIPSWGVAIILLTFIVKILLHPINKKSMASMKAMQQLQPKLEEIRKKYPNDKQQQNVETMQLFRTHKVNPLGGCLPMLLQLPIYFALYRVLWNAIELYHTPFLHYKDLSAPDPYFVAPVILGVFMFLQQKFTPNPSTDPAQKKMMMLMPIFFSAVMLFLPVGLTIYIAVNTAMSVLQQYLMRHDISLRDVIFRKVLKIKKAEG